MLSISDIIKCIEDFAPLSLQESYDNSGLQIGDTSLHATGALLCIDVIEEVVDEAISKNINLIISHHPIIFGGIKCLSGKTDMERSIIKAVKNDIVIYACHTNIDNSFEGVSYKMAQKIGLKDIKILSPIAGVLRKLVTYIPNEHLERVRNAVFDAGAGKIGNYSNCSFNVSGNGTFKASENAKPFVGTVGKQHTESETRFETVFPKHIEKEVVKALLHSHPYEEVAYDIFTLNNVNDRVGGGAIGVLQQPVDAKEFLFQLKDVFGVKNIRHTSIVKKNISTVAMCGGSGSFMLKDAIRAGAELFISGDFKYHQFFDAEKRIIIADIGHFESEQYTLEIFYDIVIKKFPNFAIYFTNVKTNPINYI